VRYNEAGEVDSVESLKSSDIVDKSSAVLIFKNLRVVGSGSAPIIAEIPSQSCALPDQ